MLTPGIQPSLDLLGAGTIKIFQPYNKASDNPGVIVRLCGAAPERDPYFFAVTPTRAGRTIQRWRRAFFI
jgi:hypothetical protein